MSPCGRVTGRRNVRLGSPTRQYITCGREIIGLGPRALPYCLLRGLSRGCLGRVLMATEPHGEFMLLRMKENIVVLQHAVAHHVTEKGGLHHPHQACIDLVLAPCHVNASLTATDWHVC